GAELDDDKVPNPNHDIFVLTRPAARAPARVTFREPGKPNFELELPLSSSLACVKAALISASMSRQRKPSDDDQCCCRPTPTGAETPAAVTPAAVTPAAATLAARDGRDHDDCTLIVRGKTMSNACLLGDYLSAPVAAPGSRRGRRRPVFVLILWRRRLQEPSESSISRQHPWQQRTVSPAVARKITSAFESRAVFVQATGRYLGGSEEGERGRWRPRRSVQRRSKSVVAFSGLKRGARCGLGVQP
ncbi:unnamed protein product, partial [Laminaria digitata]